MHGVHYFYGAWEIIEKYLHYPAHKDQSARRGRRVVAWATTVLFWNIYFSLNKKVLSTLFNISFKGVMCKFGYQMKIIKGQYLMLK